MTFVGCSKNVHADISSSNYGLGGQDGGLMVDMVNFQQFTLNTTSWQATFGSGYKLGQLDMQLHKSGGRAMAHGTCPGVGAGGHLTIVRCCLPADRVL